MAFVKFIIYGAIGNVWLTAFANVLATSGGQIVPAYFRIVDKRQVEAPPALARHPARKSLV